MITMSKAAMGTGIGAIGFVVGNQLLRFADFVMKFTGLAIDSLLYKVGRGGVVLIAGETLLAIIQKNKGFNLIPASVLSDENLMAFIGGWGPGTLLPIAKSLGLPLANVSDFEKFQQAVLTGQGLLGEEDMRGIRVAIANGLAAAGKTQGELLAFNETPMSEIAQELISAIPQMEQSLREILNASNVSSPQ